MGRHRVHEALTGPTTNLGTFGESADPAGFMREEAAAPSGPIANLQAALSVQQNRMNADLHGQPTRSIAGPLPDMAWDAFFGSLQQKGQRAADHGLRMRTDLAGEGPGTGIGQLGSTRPSGLVDHPLEDAGVSSNPLAGSQMQGLQTAANQINRNARAVSQQQRTRGF